MKQEKAGPGWISYFCLRMGAFYTNFSITTPEQFIILLANLSLPFLLHTLFLLFLCTINRCPVRTEYLHNSIITASIWERDPTCILYKLHTSYQYKTPPSTAVTCYTTTTEQTILSLYLIRCGPQCRMYVYRVFIIKWKKVSCEIEDFVETHLCKLRGILRSRVL